MKIIHAFPPNIEDIAFHVGESCRKPGVIFAYGDTIFVPGGIEVPPQLVAHEEKHSEQQEAVGGPETWWQWYLVDKVFRFEQELAAHQVEYQWVADRYSGLQLKRYLDAMAKRLSSPLYGHVVTRERAKMLIRRTL